MSRPTKLKDKTELKILNAIFDKKDRTQILAILNRTQKTGNNTLGNWLEYLEFSKELIVKLPGEIPNRYKLTYEGRQRLRNLRDSITLAHPEVFESEKVMFTLDKFSMKYPIINEGEFWTPDETKMNNWLRQTMTFRDCTIVKNGNSSIEVLISTMMGDNQYKLIVKAKAICESAGNLLEKQFGFVLGRGSNNRPGTIEISDKFTKALYKETGYVRDVIDGSKMGGELNVTGQTPGETGDLAQGIVDIPKVQTKIRQEMEKLDAKVDLLTDTVLELTQKISKDMDYRQALIQALKNLGQNEAPPPSNQEYTGVEFE